MQRAREELLLADPAQRLLAARAEQVEGPRDPAEGEAFLSAAHREALLDALAHRQGAALGVLQHPRIGRRLIAARHDAEQRLEDVLVLLIAGAGDSVASVTQRDCAGELLLVVDEAADRIAVVED